VLDDDAAEYLRWVSRNRGDGDLRPYLPGSVCEIVESVCDFEDRPRILDREMVDRVADLYFTQARELTAIRDEASLETVG
jgi:hypothetical protein